MSWRACEQVPYVAPPAYTCSHEAVCRPCGAPDTIIVPGIAEPLNQGTLDAAGRAIARAHARGARVLSICTGAFVLAHAGLLDGRRATTHWDAAARLAREYPDVDVDPTVLYVDEGTVLTSAGVAAGLDLCLHVIRRDHGAAVPARRHGSRSSPRIGTAARHSSSIGR